MARSRLLLQALLEEILGTDEVHFQPPNNTQMVYPAIVYERGGEDVDYADNELYRHMKRYTVTSINPDVDSPIPDKIRELPYCTFDRFFTADDLNHDVFTIFF